MARTENGCSCCLLGEHRRGRRKGYGTEIFLHYCTAHYPSPWFSRRGRCTCYHTVGTLISTLTLALLFPLGRLVSLVSHRPAALTRSHSRCPRIHRLLECSPSRYVVTTAQSSVRESRIGKIMSLTVVHVMHFFAGCDAQDVDRSQGPRNFRVFPPHFLSKNIHSRIDLINRIPTALRFSGEGGGDRYE